MREELRLSRKKKLLVGRRDPWKMIRTGSPETSASNHFTPNSSVFWVITQRRLLLNQPTPHNNPEDGKIQKVKLPLSKPRRRIGEEEVSLYSFLTSALRVEFW